MTRSGPAAGARQAGGGRAKRCRGQAARADVHQVRPRAVACVDREVRLGEDQREEEGDEVHPRGAGPGQRVEPGEAADLRPDEARRDRRAGQVTRGHVMA